MGDILTAQTVRAMCIRAPNESNMTSVIVAVNLYGEQFGLDLPSRLAHFLAQVLHESAEFRYDTEVWGPTPAQLRYDTRTDLGNTPEQDGDGFLYRGRTGIQITGASNYRQFRDWCRSFIGGNVPDFVAQPELVLTDPWEGLGPIWYWSTRNLNRFADQNDIEMVTRRINGGLNGFNDRINYYNRAALVLAGYGPTEVRRFQSEKNVPGGADGIAGPKTRNALHQVLVEIGPAKPVIQQPAPQQVVAPTPPARPAAPVASGPTIATPQGNLALVASIQHLLREKGYPEVGETDDIFGSRTRNAILAFQADNNLPKTGQPSEQLLLALIKAAPRVNADSRVTATAKDLKAKGDETVNNGDWLRRIGIGILGAGGLGGILEGNASLDEIIQGLTGFRRIAEIISTFSPWILLAAGGAIAVYFGSRIIEAQVKAYQQGRSV